MEADFTAAGSSSLGSYLSEEILHELRRHMVNPKASSFADTKLTEVFRLLMLVSRMPPYFAVARRQHVQIAGQVFHKGKIRRTRVLCKELKSKREYLVPADALVNDVQLSLL